MNIILFGPPGVGKGTQAKLIAKDFNLNILSLGDILREEIKNKSKIGYKIEELQNSGKLIKNDIIIQIIKDKIQNNMLFDGFPRTLDQAVFLQRLNIKIDCIINIKLNDEIIINRLKYRLIHQKSGRIYNTLYNPPKIKNIDNLTGEILIKRKDDTAESIILRLNEYKKNTHPILNYLKHIKTINIDGNNNIKNIYLNIKEKINNI